MKPLPNLIPRFNKDYNFNDFICSIKSTFSNDDVELKPLHNIFGEKSFIPTNTGRTALYVILKALNLPKGSKIGVPLYSCTVVFDAIIKAGHVPYFIDIDLDNYTLDPDDLSDKIKDLSAVIVIHTFGRPANMDRIRSVAGNLPVIEDCAHSLLSRYKGELTGTLGFASLFSFKKYLSTGGGGMIILNEQKFTGVFRREADLLNAYSKVNEIINSFATYGYAFLYHKPWFGLFSCPLWPYLRTVTANIDHIKDFKGNKIRKSDFGLLFRKLNGFEEKVELQRKNSFILLKELRDTSLTLPDQKKDTYCNYYLFPVRFNNKTERDKAYVLLRNLGIDTAKLYGETPLKAKTLYGYTGDCSNSEIVADTILVIPNYYTLDERDLTRITDCLKKVEELL